MRLQKIHDLRATRADERPLRAILRRALFLYGLASISLFSSVAVSASENVQFVDVTKKSGIDFVHVNGASGQKYLAETTGSGVGFLDYNNDGFLDIFLVNGGRTPDFSSSASADHALYRNNRDGTFTNVTRHAGIQENEWFGMGVAAADYDNDGFVDLFVTHFAGPDLLYHNDGDGGFTEVSQQAGVRGDGTWSTSAAFFDYDKDGHLDLYVVKYTDHSYEHNYICPMGIPPEKSYCSPDIYKGVPDILFHNNGDGSFSDVSQTAGIAVPAGKGLGIVTGDYDGDGWPDVYIANDRVRNFLFHNNGDGTFTELGLEAGVALDENGKAQAGMGTDIGDYDRDGRFDIVVSNLHTEYLALYRNLGKGYFEDVSRAVGTIVPTQPFVGFGVGFLDFDNDGLLDLFLANGHVLDNIRLVHASATYRQPKVLLQNTGRTFRDVTSLYGKALLSPRVSRGVAFADYDNDGDIDLLVNNCAERPQLLRNDTGHRKEWLTIELRGTRSNRSGIGALLEVVVGGKRRVFQAVGGGSFMAANDPRIHIGLDKVKEIDEMRIHWPSGLTDHFYKVRSRQILVVEEGRSGKSQVDKPAEDSLPE